MATKKQTRARVSAATHVKRTFVPHKENSYKPHLIKPAGIAVVALLVLGLQFAYHGMTASRAAVLGQTASVSVTELLKDTNAARAQNSLPPLTLSDKLDQGAYLKAQDMLAKDYWAHNAPDGTQPWKWFTQVGYDYNYAGENLAKNYADAQSTVTAWMNSPTHRANVLGTHYTDVGFAVVNGELTGQDTTLVVAFYGAPVSVASAAVQGVSTSTTFAAPTGTNPLTSFGTALQTLNPAVLAGLVILAVCCGIALLAYAFRARLPKSLRRNWRAHQGLYATACFAIVAVIVVLMSGTGQI